MKVGFNECRHLPFAQPTVVVDDLDFLNWAKWSELALQCIFGDFEVEVADVERTVWCGRWRYELSVA